LSVPLAIVFTKQSGSFVEFVRESIVPKIVRNVINVRTLTFCFVLPKLLGLEEFTRESGNLMILIQTRKANKRQERCRCPHLGHCGTRYKEADFQLADTATEQVGPPERIIMLLREAVIRQEQLCLLLLGTGA